MCRAFSVTVFQKFTHVGVLNPWVTSMTLLRSMCVAIGLTARAQTGAAATTAYT